jgi:N-acyl homoserine lactone hydrolase
MSEYVIHPVPLIVHEAEMPKMTHLQNYGKMTKIVTYVWYLEGGSHKVVVDAGGSAEMIEFRGWPGARTIQSLDEGLAKYGVRASDIDIVILTHLHHDHIAFAPEFRNARFIVQKTELEEAPRWNAHPLYRGAFPEAMINAVTMDAVEGDNQIASGIETLFTPGHTAGTQSIAVNTAKGRAVIVGACCIQANFEPGEDLKKRMSVIAPAVHLSASDAYDGLARIQEMADIIIPCHEPGFMDIPTIPE